MAENGKVTTDGLDLDKFKYKLSELEKIILYKALWKSVKVIK